MSGRREWTDEELGVLSTHVDAPHSELADMLGRTAQSVKHARRKLARGWVRERLTWTPDEDDLIRSSPLRTAAQLAKELPGRSVKAIQKRRADLGASGPAGSASRPHAVGARRMIAKTCTGCGHLLDAEKFAGRELGYKNSTCTYCRSERGALYAETREAASARWHKRMRDLTAENETRRYMPYIEADFRVIDDPSLPVVIKALLLGRTYDAIKTVAKKRGVTSPRTMLGSRDDAAWRIDNPNADRIDEITAALKQEFETAGAPFPAWDWDDEDLKETA